ncbi:MAG: peptide chain release factor 3 [Myxococcota bacterium]
MVGAVGTLQFEVLEHRLKSEYRVDAIMTTLPYTLCRWVRSKPGTAAAGDTKKAFNPRTYQRGQGSLLAKDRDEHPVVLFSNAWGINWATDKNKSFDLLPVSPLAEHAGDLK